MRFCHVEKKFMSYFIVRQISRSIDSWENHHHHQQQKKPFYLILFFTCAKQNTLDNIKCLGLVLLVTETLISQLGQCCVSFPRFFYIVYYITASFLTYRLSSSFQHVTPKVTWKQIPPPLFLLLPI